MIGNIELSLPGYFEGRILIDFQLREATRVNIELKLQGKILTDSREWRRRFNLSLVQAFNKSGRELQAIIRARTPVGATGAAYTSVTWDYGVKTPGVEAGLVEAPLELEGRVFGREEEAAIWGGLLRMGISTYCPYIRAVEVGTRPHWPPLLPIYSWVQQVLGPFDRITLSRTTFFVARKISQRGTWAHRMFRDGYEEWRSRRILETNVQEAVDEAITLARTGAPWWAEFVPGR